MRNPLLDFLVLEEAKEFKPTSLKELWDFYHNELGFSDIDIFRCYKQCVAQQIEKITPQIVAQSFYERLAIKRFGNGGDRECQ